MSGPDVKFLKDRNGAMSLHLELQAVRPPAAPEQAEALGVVEGAPRLAWRGGSFELPRPTPMRDPATGTTRLRFLAPLSAQQGEAVFAAMRDPAVGTQLVIGLKYRLALVEEGGPVMHPLPHRPIGTIPHFVPLEMRPEHLGAHNLRPDLIRPRDDPRAERAPAHGVALNRLIVSDVMLERIIQGRIDAGRGRTAAARRHHDRRAHARASHRLQLRPVARPEPADLFRRLRRGEDQERLAGHRLRHGPAGGVSQHRLHAAARDPPRLQHRPGRPAHAAGAVPVRGGRGPGARGAPAGVLVRPGEDRRPAGAALRADRGRLPSARDPRGRRFGGHAAPRRGVPGGDRDPRRRGRRGDPARRHLRPCARSVAELLPAAGQHAHRQRRPDRYGHGGHRDRRGGGAAVAGDPCRAALLPHRPGAAGAVARAGADQPRPGAGSATAPRRR